MIKRIYFLILLTLLNTQLFAQGGIVHTIAGGGTSTANGVPALNAQMTQARSICVNAAGDVFIADQATQVVRKVIASTGLIYTVAGNGIAGYTGDGGPATSASISLTTQCLTFYGLGDQQNICLDRDGNLYILCDHIIRKVNTVSGIITTVAGGGTLVDNGAIATNAGLGLPTAIACDGVGNLYVVDQSEDRPRVRKINPSGIISTVAGNGTSIFAPGSVGGNGVPATNVSLGYPFGLAIDLLGNIYFTEGDIIRKVDGATGIITTPISILTSLATALNIDNANNIYLLEGNPDGGILKVNLLTGNIIAADSASAVFSTSCGCEEGLMLCNTRIRRGGMCVDNNGDIYFTDESRVRKASNSFAGITTVADSFHSVANKVCNGLQISIAVNSYSPGKKIISNYGDGVIDTSVVLPGAGGGYCPLNHTYPLSGAYHIKHTLFSGSLAIDSVAYSIDYSFCRTLPVKLFYDENINCNKDASEHFIMTPHDISIDSNGITVDTISATSGFYYDAHGNPGDIYSFKMASGIGMYISCPATGVVSDTLHSGNNNPVKYAGIDCSSSAFDLGVSATFRAVNNAGVGDLIFYNNSCIASPATISINMSPKYNYQYASPVPDIISGNSMIWNYSSLSAIDFLPMHIHFHLQKPLGASVYLPGDTVNSSYSITPLSGDAHTSNNIIIRVDTVKSGFDPNYVEVLPDGCLHDQKQLQYTIHFENTGNDTAHNIYVLDTLPVFVDPSTLKILSSSAAMDISINKVNTYYVVKFDFKDINLLDSSHFGYCDGMVSFSINTKPDVANSSVIMNRAGIYFDTNPVIMTNTTENFNSCEFLSVPVLAKGPSAVVFPNPATDDLTIKLSNRLYTSLTITNSIGQIVMQQGISAAQTKLNIKALPAGMYYVSLMGTEGREVQKFVKW